MRPDQAYAIVKQKKLGPIVRHVPMQIKELFRGEWPKRWEPGKIKLKTGMANLEDLKLNWRT